MILVRYLKGSYLRRYEGRLRNLIRMSDVMERSFVVIRFQYNNDQIIMKFTLT